MAKILYHGIFHIFDGMMVFYVCFFNNKNSKFALRVVCDLRVAKHILSDFNESSSILIGLYCSIQLQPKIISCISINFCISCTHLRSFPHCHDMGKNTRPYF